MHAVQALVTGDCDRDPEGKKWEEGETEWEQAQGLAQVRQTAYFVLLEMQSAVVWPHTH